MKNLEILCTPDFTEDEIRDLEQAATSLGVSVEEIIRRAVRAFAAQCVPTHGGGARAECAA